MLIQVRFWRLKFCLLSVSIFVVQVNKTVNNKLYTFQFENEAEVSLNWQKEQKSKNVQKKKLTQADNFIELYKVCEKQLTSLHSARVS